MAQSFTGTIGLIGLGALGRALGCAFVRAGLDVVAWNRSPVARADVPGVQLVSALDELIAAQTFVLCVRDDAITDVAERVALAVVGAGVTVRCALHTSGCVDEQALEPFARRGAAVGWLHPLIAVARGGEVPRGTPFGVGGDAAAVEHASALAERLGGAALAVRPGRQARYHAAAALAAGGAVALAEVARALLAGALHDEDAAVEAVRHLVSSAARNLVALPFEQALTGPVVRHDVATLAAHRAALAASDEEARRAQRVLEALAPALLELVARREGAGLSTERLRALAQALGAGPRADGAAGE